MTVGCRTQVRHRRYTEPGSGLSQDILVIWHDVSLETAAQKQVNFTARVTMAICSRPVPDQNNPGDNINPVVAAV